MAINMKRVALGLGSNLGDRQRNLQRAAEEIEQYIGRIILSSSVYETEPWGFETEEQFLNMAVIVETELKPTDLIGAILSIEARSGRMRNGSKYSSRILDIDILLYGSDIIEAEGLNIPHPLMHKRRFVLEPLSEIAPRMMHPVLNRSIAELLASCTDTCSIRRIS